MNEQPVYIQALILGAIGVGIISLISKLVSAQRNIYDILTVPTFVATLAYFIVGVIPQRELIQTKITSQYTAAMQATQLYNIARYHVYIAGLLIATFVLQTMSNNVNSTRVGTAKKHN